MCAANVLIQLESSLFPVLFSPTLQSGSSPSLNWAEVHVNVDTQSFRNIRMRSFEIFSKWSVQASKHTYTRHNEATLVWGLLRLTPNTFCGTICFYSVENNVEYISLKKTGGWFNPRWVISVTESSPYHLPLLQQCSTAFVYSKVPVRHECTAFVYSKF